MKAGRVGLSFASLAAGILGCAVSHGPAASTKVARPGPSAIRVSPAAEDACSTATVPDGSPGDFVVRVQVTGNQRTARPDICKLIRTEAGRPFDRVLIASDLHEIFRSGLFDDAKATSQAESGGCAITITVHERPLAKRWAVKTVGVVPSWEPLRELGGKPGDIFDVASLKTRAERAGEELAAIGFPSASVTFHATPVNGNEVLVEGIVEAGPPQLIHEIRFPGASKVKEPDLLALLDVSLSQGRVKVNAPGGVYHTGEALELGLLRIKDRYFERGMITVKVGEPEVSTISDGRLVRLTIPIEEGPTFMIDKLSCKGYPAGTEGQCLSLLGLRHGDVFRRSQVAAGVQRIHDAITAQARNSIVQIATNLTPKAGRVDVEIVVPRLVDGQFVAP